MIRPQDIDRFLNKVTPSAGCWSFNSAKDRDGYHAYNYKTTTSNKYIKVGAHRFMMMIQGHTIPQGHVVCHKCDNPSCVNPDHLFIGTVNDNNQDKVRKGRQTRLIGEKQPKALLTNQQAKEIRARAVVGYRRGYNNGSNITALAKEYNVPTELIRRIARNELYKDI